MSDLRFALFVPQQWQELDLSPDNMSGMVECQVGQIVRMMPTLGAYRHELRKLMLKMLQTAWVSGVRYAVSMMEPAGDGYLMACLTLSVLPTLPSMEDGKELDVIGTSLREKNVEEGRDMDVSIVMLPHAGKAVRAFGIVDMQAKGNGKALPCALMQTFVPVGEKVLLVQAFTPQIEVADTMFELFDLITGTLAVETVG